MTAFLKWGCLLGAAVLMVGCLGGAADDASTAAAPGRYSLPGGVAQKGPLQQGSEVTIHELDAALARTGASHRTLVGRGLGQFSSAERSSQPYVEVTAQGHYQDEVSGRLSSAPIALSGLNDLQADETLNVNVLTTLAQGRTRALAAGGASFAQARAQAEREVLAAFGVHGRRGVAAFSALSLGGTGDGPQVLAAVSALLSTGSDAAGVAALLASMRDDLARYGRIASEATRAVLASSAAQLNAQQVARHLAAQMGGSSSAAVATAANIAAWVDADGDGVLPQAEFVVADAAAAPVYVLPPALVQPFVGAQLAVSQGVLLVDGAVAAGPQPLRQGADVALSPPPQWAGPGVVASYLTADGVRVARVSFFRGLAGIQVLPAVADVRLSTPRRFQALASFDDGSLADVSAQVLWSGNGAAGIDAGYGTGLVKAWSPGAARLTARLGPHSGESALTVAAGAELVALEISMQPLATGVEIARRLTAKATFADGSRQDVSGAVSWSSTQPQVATVAGAWVTGRSLGAAEVTAALGAVVARATVAVTGQTWAPVAAPGASRNGHTAFRLPDGRVWVGAGGRSGSFAEIFDPQSGQWSAAAAFGSASQGVRAVLLDNGRVLVSPTSQPGLYLYDAQLDRWAGTSPKPGSALGGSSLVRLGDGRVMFLGGSLLSVFDGRFRYDTFASTQVYDPAANAWAAGAPMGTARRDARALMLVDGRVLVTAGTAIRGFIIDAVSNPVHAAELFDPVLNTWSPLPNPADLRYESLRLPLGDGRLLGSPESWSPSTGLWAATGEAIGGVWALLADGQVLGVGNAVAGLFDPALGRWTSLGSGAAPRSGHTVTPLPGGAMLVLGGLAAASAGNPGLAAREAELFWR